MAKAIEQKKGLTIGIAALGIRGETTGSIRHQVHDGDNVIVRTPGNLGIRFLGVDAPEISFMLPGKKSFTRMDNSKWKAFLSDPFAEEFGLFDPPLAPGLLNYLQDRVGPGAAQNQYDHATIAEDVLEEKIFEDIEVLGQTKESFQFFLAFAHEIMDRYGRLLCFINRYQQDENKPEPRPVSYNERLLQTAKVSPYFIWPNISPFRKKNRNRSGNPSRNCK